jgi:hypothetical protein
MRSEGIPQNGNGSGPELQTFGWSIADHMRTELVADALKAAARTRGGNLHGAIFHSDYAEVLDKPRNSDLACAA